MSSKIDMDEYWRKFREPLPDIDLNDYNEEEEEIEVPDDEKLFDEQE